MSRSDSIAVRAIDGVQIVDVRGEITKQTEELLLGIFGQLTNAEGSQWLLNLTETEYINSAGIAIIIRLVRQAHQHRCHLGAYGVSSHYQKLFRMVGLSDFLDMYPDEYAALQRLAHP